MTQWSELRLHDGGPCPVGEDDVVRCLVEALNEIYWSATECVARDWKWSRIIAYQVALPEPRDMQVPWHVLPDGYRWAAVDKNKHAHAFLKEPELYQALGAWWSFIDDPIRIDQLVGYDPGTKPWDQSLIQRPEGV